MTAILDRLAFAALVATSAVLTLGAIFKTDLDRWRARRASAADLAELPGWAFAADVGRAQTFADPRPN